MPDATSGTRGFVLPSRLEVLDRVDGATLKYCRQAGFDDGLAGMVAMAAIEAVTNAVMHGNKRSPDKEVLLRYDWSPGRIEITVHDEGAGFDLTCVLDPTDPERCLASSGRGIYIMREIMDSVTFDMSAGTTVTMVKTA
ncbi:MAG: ATP-binding protein [Candidatus Eisenbacteria bacterium]|nr:ATP-binding protein [Candidatus Eisenbacteria bacterium]